ncbi:MAG: Asp-tRNA(Asn)/Glu-tRNA(Gln) amidotransferase subunit GatC, partial [Planctomycetota bacterium]
MAREVSAELVRKVARLARIRLTEDEVATFARQLGQILHYVEILDGVDTEGVEPMAHAADIVNV